MYSSQSQHSLAGANYACRHRHPRGQDVCPYQLGSVPHELTTNAAEYGALSIGQGLVHVTWQIEADNLLLRWEGPRIEKTPTSEGLGSTLVPRGPKGEKRPAEFSHGLTYRLRSKNRLRSKKLMMGL
jgi:two-component sensor histidine kinase